MVAKKKKSSEGKASQDMSRDDIAVQVASGLVVQGSRGNQVDCNLVASLSYALADALIACRDK